MITKVTGFSIINTMNGKRISYTLQEIDDTGEIIRNNIRKSFAVLETDTNILNCIDDIDNFILTKQV